MTTTSAFIIYLTIFRMAIIAAGIMSIALGYRLFCKGIFPDHPTDIDTEIAGWKIAIKNAGPGTSFALFGVLIISVMFASGSPEMTLKTMKDASQSELDSSSSTTEGTPATMTEISLRGDGKGDKLKKALDNTTAEVDTMKKALTITTNSLAWLYYQRGEIQEALPLSRLAVQLSPNDANALDTLADILYQTKEYAEAVSVMEKAVSLAPDADKSEYSQKFKGSERERESEETDTRSHTRFL
ncbi:tetratricopeptide repeat protein [Candidatus Poribacteria bacterium]|nr:tetratricopeptide repeat protein [Candidatus Poribacteria bacterium]